MKKTTNKELKNIENYFSSVFPEKAKKSLKTAIEKELKEEQEKEIEMLSNKVKNSAISFSSVRNVLEMKLKFN